MLKYIHLIYIHFISAIVWFYFSKLNRCEFRGLENVPSHTTPSLFLANHISQYETLAIPGAIVTKQKKFKIRAAAKEELLTAPYIGVLMRSFKIIPVKRGRATKAFASIIDHIKQGLSILIFPEGTRSKDGNLGRANRGMGKLMLDTEALIVPIHVSGFQQWKPFGLGQKAIINFGKPYRLDAIELPSEPSEQKIIFQQLADKSMEAIAQLAPAINAGHLQEPKPNLDS